MRWFAVRCIIRQPARGVYEERITLWRATSHEEAIARAEAEADDYAAEDGEAVGVAQSFELFDEPGDGAEVFSLMRTSDLGSDDYVSRFFDTGAERQEDIDP